MFIQKRLTFPHKAILTGSMLEEIYNYPREFSRLTFNGYSDGIICGLDYFIKDGDLILSSGIFRLGGENYFLSADLNISELAEKNNLVIDQKYFIVLEERSFASEQCITTKTLELTFAAEKTSCTLGKFIFLGKKDFSLPTFANDFNDLFLPSFFDLFDVPFATKSSPTFHPHLFRQVKNFLRAKPNKTPLDFAVLLYLMNNETISIETMNEYVAEKNITDRKEFFRAFLNSMSKSKFIVSNYLDNVRNPETTATRRPSVGKLI